MITCKQFTEQLDLYLDGETVTHGSRTGMWMHKMMCKHCRVYANQIQDVITMGAAVDKAPDEDLKCPESVKKDLLKSYKKTNPGL